MINSLGHQEPGASPSSREGVQMVEPGSGCLAAARAGAALRAGGSHGRRRERESPAPFTFRRKHFKRRIRYLGIPKSPGVRLKFQNGLEPAPRPHPRGGRGPWEGSGAPRGSEDCRGEALSGRDPNPGGHGRGNLARFPRGPANLAHTEVVGGKVQQRRRGRRSGSGFGVGITGRWPRTWPW